MVGKLLGRLKRKYEDNIILFWFAYLRFPNCIDNLT